MEGKAADEIAVDAALVRRLLAAQFPRWASMRVEPVRSAGADNAIYRLGNDLAVRLPRMPEAAAQVDKEHRWLPRLAPLLPLDVPVPLAKGRPAEGYPWPWAVHRWIDGETAARMDLAGSGHAAADLGRFVASLRRADPDGGPPTHRGAPLVSQDPDTRTALAGLGGTLDTAAAAAAWDAALRAPAWAGRPAWLHGDLIPTNLLTRRGRLVAVIDFGCLGLGDPACDLIPAWTVLSAGTRATFRATADVDDATWARGRGWALSLGLGAAFHHHARNPVLAAIGRRTVGEVLADRLTP
jgi:aminoglycoside phosphotransferase (APT) family kinase protein